MLYRIISVLILNFKHDLGEDNRGSGYDVHFWLATAHVANKEIAKRLVLS
mgnify:CR=1 FL=1